MAAVAGGVVDPATRIGSKFGFADPDRARQRSARSRRREQKPDHASTI
jgi:hypothetical protein